MLYNEANSISHSCSIQLRSRHGYLKFPSFLSSKDNNMSDKFFFDGLQDARQNHVKHGFKTNANQKIGSKKFPLTLVVNSEARQQEVEELVSDAKLYADISINSKKGAVESIVELTTLLKKGTTFKKDKTPSRNEPCICGSGKKYKKCCG